MKTPNEINMEIAARLRGRRKERKLSQVQLSERANVSLGSLKRFERTGEISLSSLVKLDQRKAKGIAADIQEIVRSELGRFLKK